MRNRYHMSFMALVASSLFIVSLVNGSEDDDVEPSVELTVIQTAEGKKVQMTVGDIVVQAKELTVVKSEKPNCVVRVDGSNVEISQGDFSASAKRISTKLHRGILSRGTSPNDLAELLFRMATGQADDGRGR